MPYTSIDALQNTLATDVFHYTRDAKKAAGRALGTLVEVITFHLLKGWGYEKHTLIERRIPEFGNPSLTHNVEFTLHPSHSLATIRLAESDLPFTARKIERQLRIDNLDKRKAKSNQLLSTQRMIRNSCTIYEDADKILVAYLGGKTRYGWSITVHNLEIHPFALFECKRVGVEEGMRKGPQTIEKAKQGAYVAGAVSSLQKVKTEDGSVYGVLPMPDDTLQIKPYDELLRTIVNSNSKDLLRHFVLTVGVVSNHGNWFTSGDHNKELDVLAQSYDWLLFLTDMGLIRFIDDLLLNPRPEYIAARDAFIHSYTGKRGRNGFTKVQMLLSADVIVQRYFAEHLSEIEDWFNIISPTGGSIATLKEDLDALIARESEELGI